MRSIKKFLLKKKSHLRKMIAPRKRLLIITFSLFVAFGSLSFFSFQGNQSTPPSVPSSSELGIAAFSPLGESGGSVVPASCPSDLHDAPANYGQACGCHNAGSIQCGGACSTSACASCYPFGVQISGEYGTMNYFDTSSVTSPDTCANHAGTFTCDNGTLLGYNPSMSYFQTCSVTSSPPPPSSCTFSGSVSWPPGCGAAVSGTLPSGASTTVTNTNAGYSGSKNYSCSNGTWIAGSEFCTPDSGPGPIAPTLTFIASPTSIVSGSSTLTWSTTNATSCFASNGWTGWKVVNGSLVVSPVATTTYTLECWSSSGVSSGPRSATVTVSAVVVPGPTTLTFTANPTSIASGGSSTLTWSTTNAASCWGVGNGWTGWKTVNGSFVVSPVVTTTYYLECFDISDVYATGQKSVTVTVTPAVPAPTLTFVANPTSVSSGGGSTLTWNTTNAVSCTASGDSSWNGAKAVGGTQTQTNITTNKTYTLVCQNSVGTTVSRTVTVSISAAVTCTSNCSTTENNHCGGQSYTGTDSCGNAETCSGTRYCDYNWKEVAP